MVLSALSFLIGVVFVQQLAELPGSTIVFLVALIVVGLLILSRYVGPSRYRLLIRAVIFAVSGLLWASFRAQHYLDHRLPEEFAGVDVQVTGVVEDIPVMQDEVQRFVFSVVSIDIDGQKLAPPEKLRLSWYYGSQVKAGERWQLLVRLKPPHGFFNPGGFDYESWLYQKGIHATGYVRKSEFNHKLVSASHFSLDSIRQRLSLYIQDVLQSHQLAGLVTALAVGDRAPIEQRHWLPLINTGTNHLVAISGLHIGLAAGFGYWIVRRVTPAKLMKRLAAQRLAISGGLLIALIYALLAGLSVPTQRALLMLSSFAFALLLKRNFRAMDALAMALLVILIWDPGSVLAAGFWFSFLAVAVIFYVFSGRLGSKSLFRQWGWMQFSIALALFPASLLLFQQTSLVSPLANFIMVPYVSFLVVPLVLLSLLLMPVSAFLSSQLLVWAASLLEFIWPVITALSDSRFAYWTQAGGSLAVTGLAMIGVVLLLAPAGIPARWLGLVLILPMLNPVPEKPGEGVFILDVLDVGQGLAAVVRTSGHSLIFDTGARFSSELDSGEAVVVPFLRQMSTNRVDRIVISHGDADHIGGAASVLAAYPQALLIGQDIDELEADRKSACKQGEKWHWDGVDFEFLHPDDQLYAKRNNRSCVLKITGPGGRLLLTGDIEQSVEQKLLQRYQAELAAEVLVVPHHGSKTSSSRAFVKAVSPEIVLFPAGYRNRYRLPNREIVANYREVTSSLLSSGFSGAIRVIFEPGAGVSVIDEYRKSHAKYWNHRPVPEWL